MWIEHSQYLLNTSFFALHRQKGGERRDVDYFVIKLKTTNLTNRTSSYHTIPLNNSRKMFMNSAQKYISTIFGFCIRIGSC
jgi:hypothetical protein